MKKYPTYKDSWVEWIGEIPCEWRMTKPKYETKIPVRYGLNISADKYREEGVVFIRITDITENGDLIPENLKYLHPNDVPDDFLLENNDILLCRSGHTVGKS